MKKMTRTMVAALAIVGIVGGGSAYAFRGGEGCSPQAQGFSPEKAASSRLEKLHADLKLTPEQESAWKSWSEPIQKQASVMGERRSEREAMAKLTAPERMEKMLERMKEHEKAIESGLASTRNFYAILSPEQRKTFDAFQPFGGKRGGSKGGQGGGPRGGPGDMPGRNPS
ncbi:MAG: Spy/CpxP family protein refolding chaperone [Zoogloeaceae bacterium]|nr:Spy/CpxP family protein refolding chaperone [Zoogloeaceae bacterium]